MRVCLVVAFLFWLPISRGIDTDWCLNHGRIPLPLKNECELKLGPYDTPYAGSYCDFKGPGEPANPCPPCLVGTPEGETIINDVTRGIWYIPADGFSPKLFLPEWFSAVFQTEIFRILAEEILHVPIRGVKGGTYGEHIICCEDDSIMIPSNEQAFVHPDLTTLPLGSYNQAHIYIPKYVLDQYPLAATPRAYGQFPEQQPPYPAAFSTPCNLLKSNSSLPCVDENLICEVYEDWANTSCVHGRYVPPQCVGSWNTSCAEALHSFPYYDIGFAEGVIKNLGLNFTFAYLGENLETEVRRRHATGEPTIFAYWEPTLLLKQVPSVVLALEPENDECRKGFVMEPTLNTASCQAPRLNEVKVAQKRTLRKDPGLRFLFESMTLSNSDVEEAFERMTNFSEINSTTAANVSCQWIRENVNRWRHWIHVEPVREPLSATVVGLIIGLIMIVFILIVVLILWLLLKGKNKGTSGSPPSAIGAVTERPVLEDNTLQCLSLVCCVIDTAPTLWARAPQEMLTVTSLFKSEGRNLIKQHHGIESTTSGRDRIRAAFRNPKDAINFSLDIQLAMTSVAMPLEIYNVYSDIDQTLRCPGSGEASEEGHITMPTEQLMTGLRVAIGADYGPGNIFTVKERGGVVVDFLGPCVAHCEALLALAYGGQTLVGEDLVRMANKKSSESEKNDPFSFEPPTLHLDPEFFHPERLSVSCINSWVMPGAHSAVEVFQILPAKFSGRTFPQPKDNNGNLRSEIMSLQSFDIEVGRRLGTGCFSSVFLAKDLISGGRMAVKVFDHVDDLAKLKREVQALHALRHPHIVRYIRTRAEENDSVYIFMELCEGGSLAQHMLLTKADPLCFNEDHTTLANDTCRLNQIRTILSQLVSAIACIHERGIIHRDIKPQNCLLSAQGDLKLADFGVSHNTRGDTASLAIGTFGTFMFMAPEVLLGRAHDFSCDIYSLGILGLSLCKWVPASLVHASTQGSTLIQYYDSNTILGVLKEDVRFAKCRGKSSPIFDFLSQCLSHSAGGRATATQLLTHAFLQDTENMDRDSLVQSLISGCNARESCHYDDLQTATDMELRLACQASGRNMLLDPGTNQSTASSRHN